jgi:hypothetical protein
LTVIEDAVAFAAEEVATFRSANRAVWRGNALSRIRVTLLARCSACNEGTAVHALAGIRVLHRTGRTGHRRAGAATAPEIELLAGTTLVADALFPAADLVCATGCSVALPLTRITLTGTGIKLLPLGAGRHALVLAADVAQATLDIDAGATDTRLTGWADMPAATAVMTVDLRINALPAANRAVVTTLARSARADLTGVADVAAGAAVVRVSIEADALLTAAGGVAKATAGVMGTLCSFEPESDRTTEDAADVLVAIIAVTSR